jgi:hypothetical protein
MLDDASLSYFNYFLTSGMLQQAPLRGCLQQTPYAGELPFSQAVRKCCDVLKMHVASVCFKCFRCLRGMLQVFQMDVAKVNRDVAYVAMVVNVCCKGLFSMFLDVLLQVCLFVCCIRFTHMLQMFY